MKNVFNPCSAPTRRVERGQVAIGLAYGIKLKPAIGINQLIRWQDVKFSDGLTAVKVRREMEARLQRG